MDDRLKEHTGALYRVDLDLSVHKVLDGIGISNSTVWSLANDAFYFADTLDGAIFRFDYDHETGTLSNRRQIVDLKGTELLRTARPSIRKGTCGMRSGTAGGSRVMRPTAASIAPSICRCRSRRVACSAERI